MSLYNRFVFDYDNDCLILKEGYVVVPLEHWSKENNSVLVPGQVFYTRQAIVETNSEISFSLVWGSGTYSDNYTQALNWDQPFIENPTTVEIMVLGKTHYKDVLSNVSVDKFILLLQEFGGIKNVEVENEVYEL